MWMTFGYEGSAILVHPTLWSDFSAHLPLIRSFSLGSNWPPEYPIFPGDGIRYHFLFYAFVGWLEALGLPLDWALNLPSALGMTLFLILLARIASVLTGSFRVAVLSVVFVILNGSLTFVRFFEQRGFSWSAISQISELKEFVSFAPWGPGMISAFWTLNIYTNQRHLAVGFALCLLLMLAALRAQRGITWILLGALLGLLPILHQPALIIAPVVGGYTFLVRKEARRGLLLAAISGFPVALYGLSLLEHRAESRFHLGYLLEEPRTLARFFDYWFQNLGLHAALMPLALIFYFKKLHLVLLPALFLFVLTNSVQFSIEAAAGHKFLNFAAALGGIGSAYILVRLWDCAREGFRRLLFRTTVATAFFLLTFSGLIDLAPISNNRRGELHQGQAVEWIARNTPPDAVFMNSTLMMNPASLSGRKIFSGWPYFAWSAGHKEDRLPIIKSFYESKDFGAMCKLLMGRNLSYFTVENTRNDPNLPRIDLEFFTSNLAAEFADEERGFYVFSREELCSKGRL